MNVIYKLKGKIGVYRITNLINGKIYIGSTTNLKRRERTHNNALKSGKHKSTHLRGSSLIYGHENFKFEILEVIEDNFNDDFKLKIFIEQREQHYLDTLLFANCNDNRFYELGYNKRRRAELNTGIKYDKSIHKNMGRKPGFKMSPEQAYQNRTRNIGRKDSEETRRKKSEAIKKYRNSPEFKEYLKLHPMKGPSEEKKKIASERYSKPLFQYDLQGNFIQEHKSVTSCQKDLNIVGVSNACTGNYTKAGGFVFIYKVDREKMSEEDFKKKIELANITHAGGNGAKQVQQIDKNTNEVIAVFKSAAEASRAVEAKGNNISAVCLGKWPTAYGYKWRYVKI